jgi:hypothetical protein
MELTWKPEEIAMVNLVLRGGKRGEAQEGCSGPSHAPPRFHCPFLP